MIPITDNIRSILRQPVITRQDIDRLRTLVKRNCYRIYRAALRSGKLAKPEKCQVCGIRKAAHGHHQDYLDPLKVTWLCEFHHRAIHSKTLVDDYEVISAILGRPRANRIFKLLSFQQQNNISDRADAGAAIQRDTVYWKKVIDSCGKACIEINRLVQPVQPVLYSPRTMTRSSAVEKALEDLENNRALYMDRAYYNLKRNLEEELASL